MNHALSGEILAKEVRFPPVFSETLGLGLDRIFKSRLVLVLVSNKINALAKLRRSARLLVLVSKFKTWVVKTEYWSWS